MECFRSVFHDTFGLQWTELVRLGAEQEGLHLSSRNERIYLSNPDSIHYLIEPSDLPPNFLDRMGLTVSADTLSRYYQHLTKGNRE